MTRRRFVLLISVLLLGAATMGLAQSAASRRGPERPRRMYFGAPPTMPHEHGAEMNDCLACHGDKNSGAPLTPHPTRVRCRQCHVPADGNAGEFRRNTFSGLTVPGPAPRLNAKAPPKMAHGY
jgi:nitrate reductase cytochrome c-type subunit